MLCLIKVSAAELRPDCAVENNCIILKYTQPLFYYTIQNSKVYYSFCCFYESTLMALNFKSMKSYFAILIFSITVLLACAKKDAIGKDEYITLTYQQTYCSDRWSTAATDSLTLDNVRTYLHLNGLYISSLSMKQTANADSCKACTCKTGKTIFVSTLNSELLKERYIELGFKLQ
jgi:hypothetical protein